MSYRVGLIGCGRMGSRYDEGRNPPEPPYSHAGAVTLHPDFELVGVADPDEGNRRDCAALWQLSEEIVFSDYREMLEATRPQVMILATPSEMRLDPIQAAVQAGVQAIICEKPLALTLEEAEKIGEACQNIPLLVNFTRRWDSAAQEAAQRILKLGQIQAVRGLYVNGIANNGAHLLDLVNWWCGGIEVTGVTPVYSGSPEVRFVVPGGGRGILTPITGCDIFELEVFCQKGIIRLRRGGSEITVQEIGTPDSLARMPVLQAPELLPSGLDFALSHLLDHLKAVLAGSESIRCGFDEGLAVTRLLDHILTWPEG
jgi:predicted dehydrogenase